MKMYCINHVFTEFLNSACENSATADSPTTIYSYTIIYKYRKQEGLVLSIFSFVCFIQFSFCFAFFSFLLFSLSFLSLTRHTKK